jgi:glycosyltransferase involved in cell wall biosynthesis
LTERPFKLLLVSNLLPTPYDPERGVFTYQLAKRLQRHCQLTLVCPLPWFPSFSVFGKIKKYREFSSVPDRYEIDGIEIWSPKYPLLPKLSEKLHATLMTLGIRNCITRLHRERSFDAVNSQWLYPDSVAVDDIARRLGIPHVATGLGCDINDFIDTSSRGERILGMLQHVDRITVVSNGLRDELEKHRIPAGKISVIPNGVDTGQFRLMDKTQCRGRLQLDSGQPLFVYIGRLSPEKSVTTLIEAAARLIDSGRQVNLALVGDGPERARLENLVATLGIGGRVRFVGKVEHAEVSLWMGAADFVCLPSIREGCPNVILEALGCGRPVVASRVGAIPDIVSGESGILFTPRDTAEMARSMEIAMGRDWDSEAIHDSVQALSWENAAQKYFEVFAGALHKPA